MKQELGFNLTDCNSKFLLFPHTQIENVCKWCRGEVTGDHHPEFCCNNDDCIKENETYLRFLDYALVGYNTIVLQQNELISLVNYLEKRFMECRKMQGMQGMQGYGTVNFDACNKC